MMLRIDIHHWFAMAAILNPKWQPKYKIPPIETKFDFQVDHDFANLFPSLVCYGGHLESKMAAKIQISSDLE
jgi:acetyl esterase/lipase